jgi:hypothetical protein
MTQKIHFLQTYGKIREMIFSLEDKIGYNSLVMRNYDNNNYTIAVISAKPCKRLSVERDTLWATADRI